MIAKSDEQEQRVPMAGYGTSETYASEIELFISLAGDSDAGILEAFLNPMNG